MKGAEKHVKSNHLGNVLAVVSDMKIPVDETQDSEVDFWVSDVMVAQDYSPFGVLLYERRFESDSYRYGLNNFEKDDEVKGTGNHISFGGYGYDPRIGSGGRWNMDPIIKPNESPYAVFGNNPIMYIDPDGRDNVIYLVAMDDARQQLKLADIEKIAQQANKMFDDMGLKTRVVVYKHDEPFDPKHIDKTDSYAFLGTKEELADIPDSRLKHDAKNLSANNPEKSNQSPYPNLNIIDPGIIIGLKELESSAEAMDVEVEQLAAFLIVHGAGHNAFGKEHVDGTAFAEGDEIANIVGGVTSRRFGERPVEKRKSLSRLVKDSKKDANNVIESIKTGFGNKTAVDNYHKNKVESAEGKKVFKNYGHPV